MAQAHIMKFVENEGNRLDRIGGLPTHIPSQLPVGPDGDELAFVAQFEIVEPRISVDGAWLIQVYQDPDGEPWPMAIVLDREAQPNLENCGREHYLIPKREIVWETLDEPVEPGDWDSVESLPSPDEGRLQLSKAGGFCYYQDAIDPEDTFLLQMKEQGLAIGVFGGQTLVLVLTVDNEVEARLG